MSHHAAAPGHAAIVSSDELLRILLTPNDPATCEAIGKELRAGYSRYESSDTENYPQLHQLTVENGAGLLARFTEDRGSGAVGLAGILDGLGWQCVLKVDAA